MRFDRKFYIVAMVIFAVFLFTTNVYAANMTVTGVNGTITLEGKLFNENDWTPLTPDANGFLKLSGTQEIIFTITPEPSYQLDNVLVHGCEYLPNPQDLDYINEVPGYCSSSTPPTTDSHFSQVSVGENGVITYHFIKPETGEPDPQEGNYSFEAVFAQIPTFTYTATNTSAGPFGVIRGPAGDSLPGEHPAPPAPLEHTIYEGSDITFDFIQSEFCQVADVLVDGASIGAVSSYTFADATSNHTIEATFEPIPIFAEFTASTASGSQVITTDDEVTFAISSVVGDLTEWKWYINNVLIDTTLTPTPLVHSFTQTGNYTVALEVSNNAAFSTYEATYDVKAGDTFSPVKNAGTGTAYLTFKEAYDGIIGAEETILMKTSMPIEEDLSFAKNVTVTLMGGYDDDFKPINGFSRIHGNVTISDGKVKVSKVIIGS